MILWMCPRSSASTSLPCDLGRLRLSKHLSLAFIDTAGSGREKLEPGVVEHASLRPRHPLHMLRQKNCCRLRTVVDGVRQLAQVLPDMAAAGGDLVQGALHELSLIHI